MPSIVPGIRATQLIMVPSFMPLGEKDPMMNKEQLVPAGIYSLI